MRKVCVVLILLVLVIPAAYAGTSVLTLRRATLTNVNDAAGLWQYAGGTVFRGPTQVGYYGLTARVINGGTNALNTSMVTITLFFSGANAGRNVTLQGAWNFGSGTATGGVSAASVPYAFLQHDGTFTVTSASPGVFTLTINWTGGGAVP